MAENESSADLAEASYRAEAHVGVGWCCCCDGFLESVCSLARTFEIRRRPATMPIIKSRCPVYAASFCWTRLRPVYCRLEFRKIRQHGHPRSAFGLGNVLYVQDAGRERIAMK